MAYRLCRCGHRKYKHKYEQYPYPIDAPFCRGKNLPNYDVNNCRCYAYDPKSNLDYLEEQYVISVDKNQNGRKV